MVTNSGFHSERKMNMDMIFQLWYNEEDGCMALFVIAIVVIIVCKISDYNKEQKYLKVRNVGRY